MGGKINAQGLFCCFALQIFFTYARRRLLNYGGCNRSGSLTFVTAVKGPTSAQARPLYNLFIYLLSTAEHSLQYTVP